MIKPRFSAKNKNGRLFIQEHERFVEHLASLPSDIYLVVGDAKEKLGRSNSQNAYYFGVVIDLICKETGETKEHTHKALKELHLSEYVDFGGGRVKITRSTKELTTKEMEEYLDKVRMWAAEFLGLNIPEPQEVG